jgi:hypothetical protein
MQPPLQHYNMPGLAQNPFQYQQRKCNFVSIEMRETLMFLLEPRSQQPSSHQQLQYQQAALAAQQQHYPFYK